MIVTASSNDLNVSKHESMAQRAYRIIRADIISGARHPGERLRIEMLKTVYDIGPTPLREALQKLSTEGLVLALEKRGFMVSPLDLDEFSDLNIARIEIEKVALTRSIALGDSQWESRVVAATYLMNKEDEALLASGDGVSDAWESANAEFHASHDCCLWIKMVVANARSSARYVRALSPVINKSKHQKNRKWQP